MGERRISIALSDQAHAMVDQLLATGIHGRSKADVVQRLVYQELRTLCSKGEAGLTPDRVGGRRR